MLASGASDPTIFQNKQFLFGMVTPTNRLFSLILRALSIRGVKTVSYLTEDTAYTNSVCNSIEGIITDLGGSLVGGQTIPQNGDNASITAALDVLNDLNADVIVGCTIEK